MPPTLDAIQGQKPFAIASSNALGSLSVLGSITKIFPLLFKMDKPLLVYERTGQQNSPYQHNLILLLSSCMAFKKCPPPNIVDVKTYRPCCLSKDIGLEISGIWPLATVAQMNQTKNQFSGYFLNDFWSLGKMLLL